MGEQAYFCATEGCPLHVTTQHPNVHGCGHWAEIDGVLYDRHPLVPGGPVYCSRCRRELSRVAGSLLQAGVDPAAKGLQRFDYD